MLRKWKRADKDDKGENSTNAERQRKGQDSKKLKTYYLPAFSLEITSRCNYGRNGFLDTNLSLPQERKGCRRKSRGMNDLLFIDKMIMRLS